MFLTPRQVSRFFSTSSTPLAWWPNAGSRHVTPCRMRGGQVGEGRVASQQLACEAKCQQPSSNGYGGKERKKEHGGHRQEHMHAMSLCENNGSHLFTSFSTLFSCHFLVCLIESRQECPKSRFKASLPEQVPVPSSCLPVLF